MPICRTKHLITKGLKMRGTNYLTNIDITAKVKNVPDPKGVPPTRGPKPPPPPKPPPSPPKKA